MIDTWITSWVQPRGAGRVALLQYCDDLVICYRYDRDAQRIRRVLPKRLGRYQLRLSEERLEDEAVRTVVLTGIVWLGMMSLYPSVATAQNTGLPADKIALRYRIEFLDKDQWKPVEKNKKFKRNHTIRIRFMSNEAGNLYVLNNSDEAVSLHPIFPQGAGEGLRPYLGMGTHIEANRAGVFPDPQQGGGGLRFTGVEGKERFLFVFVPDDLGGRREVMGIPAGAENWDFDAKTTYMATGELGYILFHYFELKSK